MQSLADSGRLAQLMEELRSGQVGSFINQAARLIVEQMLAAEVDEALGRASYQRREEGQAGYRNGFKSRTLKTAEGPLEIKLPQVRDTEQPFRSELWQALGRKSPALQKLAVEMYARGLSTRDIEDLLAELCEGEDQTLLSKSAVSCVTEALWEEYQAFTKRDLGGFDVVYLFCDAVYESLRQQGCCTQAVLVTWGVCSDGSKVLLHMSLGNHETGQSRAKELIEKYQKKLPSAMDCLADDLEASLAHLKLPSLHQKMIRTTNLCERSFVEERRRTKVIPRFFDEKSCLKLVFATLWRASVRWRKVRFNEMEKQQLEAYIRVRRAMGKKVRSIA